MRSWEVEELFFSAGVIFFMEDGKRWKPGREEKEGSQEDLLTFNTDFKEPEKTEPVFKAHP